MKSIKFSSVNLSNLSKATDAELVNLIKAGDSKLAELAVAVLYKRHSATVRNAVFACIHENREAGYIADESTQAAFISVLAAIKDGSYTDDGKLRAYLIRSARNKALDALRKAETKNTRFTDFSDQSEAFKVNKANRAASMCDEPDAVESGFSFAECGFSNAGSDNYESDSYESNIMDSDVADFSSEVLMNLVDKCIPNLPQEQRDVFCLRMMGGTYAEVLERYGHVSHLVPDATDVSYKDIAQKLNINPNTATSRFKYAVNSLKKMIGEGAA